jgi:hypothetical protein
VESVGTRRRYAWRWFAVVGLLLMTPSLAACRSDGCDGPGPTATIIGELVGRDGSTATFSIESVEQVAESRTTPPPTLIRGRTLTVHYYRDRSRFLHVGTSYRVQLYGSGSDGFQSDVHMAGDPCSGGTVYANGHGINTSSWLRSHIGVLVAVVIVVPLALAGLFILALRAVSRRRRSTRAATQ